MVETLILSFKILLSAWFITNFDPVISLLDKVEDRLNEKYVKILYPFQCFKCLTLWSVLIITQDIWLALSFSFIASVYDNN
jgi:hypothetical protein